MAADAAAAMLYETLEAACMNLRIVVVQRRMTHYRVAFFEQLRLQLAQRGAGLVLAYGRGTAVEQGKDDAAELPWGVPLATTYLAGGRLCYQPLGGVTAGADLLVVTPENKLICNLWHQFTAQPYRVGLWGHGANLQGSPSSWRERFKRYVATRADWWFGYTGMSVPLIEASGFPASRITVLNNSVDTAGLAAMRAAVTPARLAALRAELGLQGGRVGIYVGSLYAEKRIDFLLEAATRIRAGRPDFELLIVGSGPQQGLVEAFCRQHAWAHYLGVRKGPAKVELMAMAQIMLNPGLVGLGILDSFVCGVPMVTTDCGLHSPEIVYLQDGENGVMTADTLDAYAGAVSALLDDQEKFAKLKAGCERSAKIYTVENMARNFADGVMACLHAPRQRGSATPAAAPALSPRSEKS